MIRVVMAHNLGLSHLSQSLRGVLTNGLEHQEPGLVCVVEAQETLLDQGADSRHHVELRAPGHLLRSFEGAATGEDGKACQKLLLRRIQELVAPVDGGTHAL